MGKNKMKEIKTISEGKNYTAVSVGKMCDLHEFELPLGPDTTMKGKVFAGSALKATGSEISFQHLNPGEGCTPTNNMRNSTSSSKAKANTRWTARYSLFPKAR